MASENPYDISVSFEHTEKDLLELLERLNRRTSKVPPVTHSPELSALALEKLETMKEIRRAIGSAHDRCILVRAQYIDSLRSSTVASSIVMRGASNYEISSSSINNTGKRKGKKRTRDLKLEEDTTIEPSSNKAFSKRPRIAWSRSPNLSSNPESYPHQAFGPDGLSVGVLSTGHSPIAPAQDTKISTQPKITATKSIRDQQQENWENRADKGIVYGMIKNPTRLSVEIVCNEYRKGSSATLGIPSRTLEKEFGTRWRASTTKRKMWSRRKPIYEEMERMVDYCLGSMNTPNVSENDPRREQIESRAINWLQAWAGLEKHANSVGKRIEAIRKIQPNGELPPYGVGGNKYLRLGPWFSGSSQPLPLDPVQQPVAEEESLPNKYWDEYDSENDDDNQDDDADEDQEHYGKVDSVFKSEHAEAVQQPVDGPPPNPSSAHIPLQCLDSVSSVPPAQQSLSTSISPHSPPYTKPLNHGRPWDL